MSEGFKKVVESTNMSFRDFPVGVNAIAAALTFAFTSNARTSALVGAGVGTALEIFALDDEEKVVDDTVDDTAGGGDTIDTTLVDVAGISMQNVFDNNINIPYVADPASELEASGAEAVISFDPGSNTYFVERTYPETDRTKFEMSLMGDVVTAVDPLGTNSTPFASVGALIQAISQNKVAWTFANGMVPNFTDTLETDTGFVDISVDVVEYGLHEHWSELLLAELNVPPFPPTEEDKWFGGSKSWAALAYSYAMDEELRAFYDQLPVPTRFNVSAHVGYGPLEASGAPSGVVS